jgi:hypothetical protein
MCPQTYNVNFIVRTLFFLRTEFVGVRGRCTDKKGNKIFLKYKEIQKGAVEKSYMTKGLLIYD